MGSRGENIVKCIADYKFQEQRVSEAIHLITWCTSSMDIKYHTRLKQAGIYVLGGVIILSCNNVTLRCCLLAPFEALFP